MDDGKEQFVSEPIEPEAGSMDSAAMSRGEPGLPRRFKWRGTLYEIADVEETWKTTGLSSGERYLRRHWYRVLTGSGERMTIYCQRQVADRKKGRSRWWLYTLTPTPPAPPAQDQT